MSERPAGAAETAAAAPPRRRPRPLLRALNALLFGAFAAAAFGAIARRAWLFWSSQGVLHPALPWDVPMGALFLSLALLLALETLRTGALAASGSPLRARDRWPLLLLVLGSFATRLAAAEPRPPASPTARLVSALRLAAETLDRGYRDAGHYSFDEAALEQALAPLGSSGFVYRGHDLPLRVRALDQDAAQRAPLPGDLPGVLYVAHPRDGQRAWLSAVTLDGSSAAMLPAPSGRALLIDARAGTHSAPGRDPLLPEYPGAKAQ